MVREITHPRACRSRKVVKMRHFKLLLAFMLGIAASSIILQNKEYSQIRFCTTGLPDLDDQLARGFLLRYFLDVSSKEIIGAPSSKEVHQWRAEKFEKIEHEIVTNSMNLFTYLATGEQRSWRISLSAGENCGYHVGIDYIK